jgi:hypothetical protein
MDQSVNNFYTSKGENDAFGLAGHSCSVCDEDIDLLRQIEQSDSEAHIAELESRRWHLRTRLNESHDPFIHKLPPEVASLIFIMALPQQNLKLFPWVQDVIDKGFNPLFLGAVCQTWRQIAWTTPELWTTFIHKVMTPLPLTESYPKISADWLNRSGTLPLTIIFIHLWVSIDDTNIVDGPANALVDVIKRHSSRCKSLHLDLHPSFMQSFCDSLSVDNLRTLSIKNHPTSFNAQTPPKLTHLNLIHVQLQHVQVRCESLTHVWFRSIGIDGCIEVIRRAPLLEYGSFGHVFGSQFAFPITPTVYHRDKLRFLHIDSPWDFRITRALAVPALERLSYAFAGDNPIDEMISLIRRSSCQVKTLRCDGKAQPRDLVRLLRAMPSLEKLTLGMNLLDDVMLLDKFLERLSDPPLDPTNDDDTAFLPRLRYLCFEGYQSFSCDRLHDMLSCSHRKSMVFKAFVVCRLVVTDDVTLRLLRLVEEGVNLSIFLWDRPFGGGKRPPGDFLRDARARLKA